jgi:hypothetical protein
MEHEAVIRRLPASGGPERLGQWLPVLERANLVDVKGKRLRRPIS